MIRPQFPGEHVDDMLRRLKKETSKDDTLRLLRRASEFTPRSQARRTKSDRAGRRRDK
jgi:ribosomal protein S21